MVCNDETSNRAQIHGCSYTRLLLTSLIDIDEKRWQFEFIFSSMLMKKSGIKITGYIYVVVLRRIQKNNLLFKAFIFLPMLRECPTPSAPLYTFMYEWQNSRSQVATRTFDGSITIVLCTSASAVRTNWSKLVKVIY